MDYTPRLHPGSARSESARPEALIGPVEAPAVHVMSWNIRRRISRPSLKAADRWPQRAPRLRRLLAAERPTVVGVQEALADQAFVVQESLGERYRMLGRGRGTAGRGEGNPIIYDASRLELLDWEQFALSKRPRKAGSRSWGSVYPRIMVSATFRDLSTGRSFLAINTHLDHISAPARLRAARMLRKAVTGSGLPVIITGDFNAAAEAPPLRELQSGELLLDTWAAARRHLSPEWDTLARYHPPTVSGARIDWILCSPSFQVSSAAINAVRHCGGWASDHLPVQAVLRLAGWPRGSRSGCSRSWC
ncbi:endonuclease/exonuclease/phosphatase family protein [Nesterenkonia sphaerica]|uniref:Endonuclease/exonuclease/phosphatase family protein n=1 Tax=Nesterenkonia sphaerica TaxID=1804988 RepID=A0A5R9A6A0_9MICC|nr:endonuclease/exonuclease/phosphatase family protein [Nesterenkonia sphaerica]TLP74222.1 endonuclease/exonuclease/phosphatase family protein [Nesterenkonia sphaerica]